MGAPQLQHKMWNLFTIGQRIKVFWDVALSFGEWLPAFRSTFLPAAAIMAHFLADIHKIRGRPTFTNFVGVAGRSYNRRNNISAWTIS
jgi:hypothetical protein